MLKVQKIVSSFLAHCTQNSVVFGWPFFLKTSASQYRIPVYSWKRTVWIV